MVTSCNVLMYYLLQLLSLKRLQRASNARHSPASRSTKKHGRMDDDEGNDDDDHDDDYSKSCLLRGRSSSV